MKAFLIKEVLKAVQHLEFRGDTEREIRSAVGIEDALGNDHNDSMSWVSDTRLQRVEPDQLNVGLLVLSEEAYQRLKTARANFMIVTNPRVTFFEIIERYARAARPSGVETSARVDAGAVIGNNCYLGHNVVVEKNCRIGDNTQVLHNTVLLEGTIVGKNVMIGCNNTIGNYGFGYEKDASGNYFKLEHMGNVIIHDNVEIHNNTCVDRAVMGSTEIHENSKIDNLVHIAHGVKIGRNSLVIANAMVAGSVQVGENSWIAPSVSILNKIVLAPGTKTGMGAVVVTDTESDATYVGNPATTMEQYKKWSAIRRRLIDQKD
jgi:UDP-3-O-[3-hydroxymyristoyl] glucosamine N-acyltransferase